MFSAKTLGLTEGSAATICYLQQECNELMQRRLADDLEMLQSESLQDPPRVSVHAIISGASRESRVKALYLPTA